MTDYDEYHEYDRAALRQTAVTGFTLYRPMLSPSMDLMPPTWANHERYTRNIDHVRVDHRIRRTLDGIPRGYTVTGGELVPLASIPVG